MYTFDYDTADSAWRQAASLVYHYGQLVPTRSEPTKELLHACFEIGDPRQRIVYARPINPAFAIAEVLWILSGSNRVDFLEFWNPRMKTWSDNGVTMRGAYGFRLGTGTHLNPHEFQLKSFYGMEEPPGSEFDQLLAAAQVLKQDPMSRQVVLQIWERDADFPNPSGPRSKDVPCNLFADLKVRNGKLYWAQYMRSNDLMWGTPYNFIQWMTIQEIVAGWLGLDVGPYHVITSSLHVYEKHWDDLAVTMRLPTESLPINQADLRLPYDEYSKVFRIVLKAARDYAQAKELMELRRIMDQALGDLDDYPAWQDWVTLLCSEALRRNGYVDEAVQVNVAYTEEFYAQSWASWNWHTQR